MRIDRPDSKSDAARTRVVQAALVALLAFGAWATPAGARVATWMGGPGCGAKYEWSQHPARFLYFCDGAAFVEHARWRNWGQTTAIAHATMNEADLRHGASVGSAPRIRSAVTVRATRIQTCGGRRAYTSISIRFGGSHKGLRTLRYPSYLPPCSAGSPSPVTPELWSALGATVRCGPTAPPLSELLCQSMAIPPPATPQDGDPGFAFLPTEGAPTVAWVSQLLWTKYGPFTPLAAGATWSDKALGIDCEIQASEVRCSNRSGHGFVIGQTGYAPF